MKCGPNAFRPLWLRSSLSQSVSPGNSLGSADRRRNTQLESQLILHTVWVPPRSGQLQGGYGCFWGIFKDNGKWTLPTVKESEQGCAVWVNADVACVLTSQSLDLGPWPDWSRVGPLVSGSEVTFLEDGAQEVWEWVMFQMDPNHKDSCVPWMFTRGGVQQRGAFNPVPATMPSPSLWDHELSGNSYRSEAQLHVLLSQDPPLSAHLKPQRPN